MTPATLLAARLRSHRLTAPAPSVTDAAAHLLAVQSQDLTAGRWALGVRTRGAPTMADVDAAFDSGALVRAWTMRGTLLIVPARDLRWMLRVTADRQRRQAASRHRALGIDDDMVVAAARALRPALGDGGCTRAEAFAQFESVGIDPAGQRGVHLLFALTLDGVICQGQITTNPAGTREQRFMDADAWIRESSEPDDPLTELFVRYIAGHGPAGVADFAWWSGLTLSAAREAAERGRSRVREADDGLFVAMRAPRRTIEDAATFALPAFDEYYISYADRTPVCAPENLAAVGPGKNGMVRATIVEHGRVTGTWSHTATARRQAPVLFSAERETADAASAVARFERFLGG